MNKLFKYRPLSEFLFKELHYQELYFASYDELNDPLDLSARIDFTSKDREAIEYLMWFIFKTQFDFDEFQKTNENVNKLLKFNEDEKSRNLLTDEIFKNVNTTLEKQENIWTHDIIKINESIEKTETDIVFNSHKFQTELERITNKFLKNSYTGTDKMDGSVTNYTEYWNYFALGERSKLNGHLAYIDDTYIFNFEFHYGFAGCLS